MLLPELTNHFLSEVYSDYREKTVVDPKQRIVTRDASNSIKMIVFHCADEEGWSPDRLSNFFVYERKFPICAYHYYVTGNKVWHMVGENILTYHAAPYNKDSVAFSIEYFASRDDKLNMKLRPELYENAIRTAAFLCMKFKVLPIKGKLVGHRELFGTGWVKDKNDQPILRKTCPGLAVDLDTFRYEVAKRIQNALNHFGATPALAVDGVFGPKTIQVFNNLPKF